MRRRPIREVRWVLLEDVERLLRTLHHLGHDAAATAVRAWWEALR